MKTGILLLSLLVCASLLSAQTINITGLYENYDNYKETQLNKRRVNPSTLLKLTESLKNNQDFDIEPLGKSLEGRKINLIRYGTGKTKVLLWSQMHGDESTATRALFDIFNFLSANDDFNNLRELIKSKLALFFIPMLNPDGAERFTRRNAMQIDLNRDAERLQFPEALILKSVRDSIQPEFGFNLHDQMKYYTAGNTFKSAALSFLAPAFNYEKDINGVRANTMKVIVDIKNQLNQFIPGHLGRYSDDFEPRAFGDNMVKWGTSSILIESGWWKDDNDKQFVRKLNFLAIISALHSIATGSYANNNIEDYFSIPQNEKLLFDIILRNAFIEFKGNKYRIDVAIKQNEKELEEEKYYYIGSTEDIGDLSVFYGYTDIDCSGMTIHTGMTYDARQWVSEDFRKEIIIELIEKGFTTLLVNEGEFTSPSSPLFINFTVNPDYDNKFELGSNPNIFLETKGEIHYVIINGFLYDVRIKKGLAKNGILLN